MYMRRVACLARAATNDTLPVNGKCTFVNMVKRSPCPISDIEGLISIFGEANSLILFPKNFVIKRTIQHAPQKKNREHTSTAVVQHYTRLPSASRAGSNLARFEYAVRAVVLCVPFLLYGSSCFFIELCDL